MINYLFKKFIMMAIEAPNTNNRIESETISYKDALAVISNEVKNATVSSNRKIESITNPDYAQIIKEIKSPESIWKMKGVRFGNDLDFIFVVSCGSKVYNVSYDIEYNMISIAYPPHDGEIFKPNNIKNGFSVVKTLMDKYTTNFGTKAGKELEIDDQQKTLLQALIKDI